MKKFKLFALSTLLFTSFALGACSGGQGGVTPTTSGQGGGSGGDVTSSAPAPVNPDGTVDIYLVVKDGKYDGKAGQDYEALFIENAFLFNAKPGTDLPGADKVTSNTGATFLGWMAYEGGGAPTQYTKVPEKNHFILYANFDLGGGGVTPTPTPTPTPTGATTFTWTVDWIWNNDAVVLAWVWGGSHGAGEFLAVTKVSDKSASVELGDATGCCFGRFAPGTTTSSARWDTEYNKSKDANMTDHTVSW